MATRTRTVALTGAVEGAVDEVVLRRVAAHAERHLETVYVTEGKTNLLKRLPRFNAAAAHTPWIVLIDLDMTECAVELRRSHLPDPSALMTFRVAVRAVEAWLLADRYGLARFLAVSDARLPADPDAESDPKQTLVNIARHSRRRAIRDDVVPRAGSGRRVGPAYEARLIEFVHGVGAEGWDPERAAFSSSSLASCLRALRA